MLKGVQKGAKAIGGKVAVVGFFFFFFFRLIREGKCRGGESFK